MIPPGFKRISPPIVGSGSDDPISSGSHTGRSRACPTHTQESTRDFFQPPMRGHFQMWLLTDVFYVLQSRSPSRTLRRSPGSREIAQPRLRSRLRDPCPPRTMPRIMGARPPPSTPLGSMVPSTTPWRRCPCPMLGTTRRSETTEHAAIVRPKDEAWSLGVWTRTSVCLHCFLRFFWSYSVDQLGITDHEHVIRTFHEHWTPC